ncbi:MAG: hypothetical protein M3R72_04750 [Bacteroidota bacterium]|nr:hypothetical protein [Bacteroidota bacterium]
MKAEFDVVVVVPVGPDSSVSFIEDTMAGYHHYTQSSYQIVFADDSQQGIGKELKTKFPTADVITTTKAMGGWAGLYITLSLAFRHAVEQYHCKAVLKLDTDALIIGKAPEKEAIALFSAQANAGIAGQYPTDYWGKPWNLNWPKQRIINGTQTWKFFRRPIANWQLIKLYKKALGNGYATGESVFGGAYFMSEAFLICLYQNGLLPNAAFRSLNLGEDHLFSLLAKAFGFTLENLSGKNKPFGCAWKGLPVSPEELIADNKKIIHSVRYWNDKNESDIRTFFKERRGEKGNEMNSFLHQ